MIKILINYFVNLGNHLQEKKLEPNTKGIAAMPVNRLEKDKPESGL